MKKTPTKCSSTSTRDRSARAWSARYSRQHKPVRVQPPPGFTPPDKVRVYARNGHYLLQWWDPGAGRTLNERVDGDLLDAFTRARQLDGNLASLGRGGGVHATQITHTELVTRYLQALEHRADSDNLALSTVKRYRGALGHYLAYTDQHAVTGKARYAGRVDAAFVARFRAYLRSIPSLAGPDYVLSVVRAMYLWAAEPSHGGLLPAAFVNPLLGQVTRRSRRQRPSLLEAPAVTAEMAAELIRVSDDYQLRLLAPVVFFGLRPSELCLLTREDIQGGFLNVYCVAELDHATKGNLDKRLPLPQSLQQLLLSDKTPGVRGGLLMQRRPVAGGRKTSRFAGLDKVGLIDAYRCLLSKEKVVTAKTRDTLRKAVIRDAGGVSYKQVYTEFGRLRKKVGWPDTVTLKDLRHLFATFTHDAGMPERYRRFLMGHAPGGEAIVDYTHLAKVREHYDLAVQREFAGVLEALQQRLNAPLYNAA
ncbi:MAG: hypothetical protein R3C45_03990 [Phycisphaerales bacterium]